MDGLFGILLLLFVGYFLGLIFHPQTTSRILKILQTFKEDRRNLYKNLDIYFIVFAVLTTLFVFLYFWIKRNQLPEAIQLGIFLATFFTLIYTVLIKDGPSRFRARPIIDIGFDLDADSDLTRDYIGLINMSVPAYYIHFRVINVGKSTLNNVEVILEDIEPFNKPFIPQRLTWALTENQLDRGVTRIPQRSFRSIDLITIKHSDRSLEVAEKFLLINNPLLSKRFIELGKGFRVGSVNEPHNLSDIVPVGKYKLYLSICSDNLPPTYVKFSVEYNGIWSEDIDKMLSENVNVKLESFGNHRNKVFNKT